MPVSSSTEHWIKPDALTINLNHFGDPDYLQVSVLAGAVVMAFKQDVIGYNAAHNYRTWQLEAANTYLETSSVYNIYARLTRSEVNARALIVYDTVLRDIEGREISYTENGNEVLGDASTDYFFVFLGQISGSVGSNGQSVQREWLIDFRFGSLDTSQYRNEESGGEWQKMFRLNKMTDMIDVLKTFSSATFKKLFIGEKVVSGIKRSIDNDNESPVSDETIPTTKYINKVIDDMDGKFLRKDKDDRSVGKISSDKGFEAGTYVKGLVGGSGAWIGADGYGEMSGLTLREFFEVPEYRNNRVDVVSGELWNAVAFGLVEEVEITGEETGILKIKLEENERCGLHVGDYCRGIFADFSGGSNWEGPDECKFLHLYGFSTSYFTPKKIIESKEGLFVCEYALKPETKQHPTKSMKFAVYGNPTDTTRQASAYATRTYKRYLNKVDTWVIDPDKHIYAQYGDLNGLVIDGVEMKGYGSFQSNAYFKGVQIQLSPEQLESLKGDSAYSAQLTNNVGTIRLDKDGNMAEGLYEESIVTAIKDGEEAEVTAKDENGQESSVTVTNHKLTTTVQAYKGNVPLFYSSSATSGSFAVSLTCVGCTAFVVNGSVVVSSITNTKDCRVNVTVNCEGMAVYNLVYNVVFVQDGKDGNSGQNAELYELTPSNVIISKDSSGNIEPGSVKYQLLLHDGSLTITISATWELRGKKTNSDSWSTIFTTGNTSLKEYNANYSNYIAQGYRLFEVKATRLDITKSYTSTASLVQDGEDGNGIKSITEYYLAYDKKTGVSTSLNDFNWVTWMPELDSTNKYLWNYELIEYTNGDKTSSTPVVIGTFSQDGRGIKSITEYYLAYPYNTGVTKNTDGWSTTVPTIDSTNKYLWNYEVVTYTDNYKEETKPVVIGVYGDTGNNAVSYAISPENLLIGKTMTGSLEPETATFKVWKNDGGEKTNITAQWYVLGKKAPSTGQGDVLMGSSGIWGGSLDVNFAGYVRDGYKYFEVQAEIEAGGSLSLVSNVVVVQDGEKGDPGVSGAMARYRGEFVFNNDEPYVYDSEYRDIIIFEGNVYQVYAFGSSVTEAPTVSGDSDNDEKWQRANKFRFVAMDTALIDSANIGGFMFKRNKYIDGMPVGKLESQYGPIVITDIAYNTSRTAEAMMSIVCDGNTYTESTTIVKMKNGIIHSLQPSVKYIRMDKDGGYVDTYISCGLMYSSTLPTGYTLKFSKDSGTESAYTLGHLISTSSTKNVFTFSMYDSTGVLVERQHVYVLKEDDSTVRFVYDNYVQVACNEDNSIKSGLPIRFNIVAYKGWDEVPITSMSVSGSGLTVDNDRIELDAETGTFKCSNVNLSGVINATGGIFKNIDVVSGTIGGLTISENSISSAKDKKGMKIQGESILFDYSGTEFIRINSTSDQALFYGRMDNGVLMDLRAYGDGDGAGATALNILCNSSGIGKAINSVGENFFISRYPSSSGNKEQTMIAGLSLSCKEGTTFSDPSNVDNESAWVDFLVATGPITLPLASSCPGKMIFIKIKGGTRTITSSYKSSTEKDLIYKSSNNETYTSDSFNNRALFFISDGSAWYEFTCYTR